MSEQAPPPHPGPPAQSKGQAVKSLTTIRKIVFASGDHTVSLALSSLGLVFFFFMVDIAGLDPKLAGVVVWLARLVDAFSDPMMGRLSDHSTSRFGRRRPFFLLGAVPFGLFFGLLWVVPGEGQSLLFGYYLIVYVGLCLSMTVLSVPYMALIPEMARDYDERTSLNVFRSTAAITGAMVAASFFEFAKLAGGGAEGYFTVGIAMGIWMILPWPAVFAVSFENAPTSEAPTMSLWASLRELAMHQTYRRLCALFIFARVGVDVMALAVPFFMAYWIGRKDDTTWFLLTLMSVVVVSLPVWLQIAKRVDKHHIFVIGSTWWFATLVVMGFADPTWERSTMLVLAGAIGIGYAVADLMPWAMLPDVIDEGELASGERREGLYNGVFTFLRKAGGATAYLMAGVLLDVSGYVKGTDQTPSALNAIRGLTTIAPAVFLALAIFVARTYPLTRSKHTEIRQALDAREQSQA